MYTPLFILHNNLHGVQVVPNVLYAHPVPMCWHTHVCVQCVLIFFVHVHVHVHHRSSSYMHVHVYSCHLLTCISCTYHILQCTLVNTASLSANNNRLPVSM